MIKRQWWQVHAGYLKPANDGFEDIGFSPQEDPAEQVVKITRELWQDQGRARKQRQDDCLELYYGCDWASDDDGIGGALAANGIAPEPTGYNVIQSITDTSVSRLVQNRIRPLILTENGNAEQQQQAEALQKVVEGTFWDAKIYGDRGEHICFDGHLTDAGGIKVYPDYAGMRPVLDRIDACRFLVSPRESRLGNPRSAYYYDAIDRSEMLAMFREAESDVIQAIQDANPAPEDIAHGDREEWVDDIEVFEAWHLPSSSVDRTDPKSWGLNEDGVFDPEIDPGHDGYRILCIEGKTLIAEPWPFPYFPVAWFKPMKKRRSYWSRSVPEVLAGAQLAINKMNARVDAIMHMHARPIIGVWKNAKINVKKITNGVATILETAVPPSQAMQYIVPQAVPNEYLNRIDTIASWAERQWGINEMAITGAKPAGIDHAPGMQHLSDELSARHTTKSHAWESFHQDLAQLTIDCHRMLADRAKQDGKDYKVVFGGDRDLEEIDWDDADLTAAVYRVKCWPTNLLPQTPAAKADKLMQWADSGLITMEQALTMIDHPDTDSLVGDHASKRLNIEKKIAKLLGGAPFEACMPHPYMDLDLAKTIAGSRLNEYEAKGYDDEDLDKLRQFYETADELLKKQQPPAPPAGPPGMLPPGPPGPMPPPANDGGAPPIAMPPAA